MPEPLEKIANETRIGFKKIAEIKRKIKNIQDLGRFINESLAKNTSEVLEIILGGAIELEASDIHIEPEELSAKVRLRADGLLQDATSVNNEAYKNIISRLKLLSGLKINVQNRPQDGRFSIFIEGEDMKKTEIEVRASTLPSQYGETAVLRILNPKNLISLEALGLRKDLLETFRREILKPNGMIIVTGPTGSGKTTTLYAFLKEINKPEVKIITIEDPIEYHLKGVSQTQTDPEKGYDFASGLKSIVRQDPDVILVGEIRDLETADISLQAALTGHLVFATMHTNDAAGTIARFKSLGAKTANIAPALSMVVAQRLVRKICDSCKEFRPATDSEMQKIRLGLAGLPKNIGPQKLDKAVKIPKAKGCSACGSTGYKGRVGIFEALLKDDDLEDVILKNPSIVALRKEMIKKGMATMYQDGLIKVLQGVTTLEEVEKNVDL